MLVAKLKKQLELIVQISPKKRETRVVDAFSITPINYSLNAKRVDFSIQMFKQEVVPKNPSSDVLGEGEVEVRYDIQKIFHESLSSEEISSWGNDDEELLHIFANKYDLEIDVITS